MPFKVTTADGKDHDVVEDVTLDDLLAGNTKHPGWVQVSQPRGAGYVQLKHIIRIAEWNADTGAAPPHGHALRDPG